MSNCNHISVQGCYCQKREEGKSYFICSNCNHTSWYQDQNYYLDKLQDQELICPSCNSKKIRFEEYKIPVPIQPRIKIGRNEKCPNCIKDNIIIKWKRCKKHNIDI